MGKAWQALVVQFHLAPGGGAKVVGLLLCRSRLVQVSKACLPNVLAPSTLQKLAKMRDTRCALPIGMQSGCQDANYPEP